MSETYTDMMAIEQAAARYRNARDRLRERATEANTQLELVKNGHLPGLRESLADVAATEAELRRAIQDSPQTLWQRVRTRVVHGVKVGFSKQRGRVEFDDEAKVIERIRKLLPGDQAALLIRTREAVHKPGVYDLTAGDLRRLGITVADDCDQVYVKDLASELDRALEALLAQAAQVED